MRTSWDSPESRGGSRQAVNKRLLFWGEEGRKREEKANVRSGMSSPSILHPCPPVQQAASTRLEVEPEVLSHLID